MGETPDVTKSPRIHGTGRRGRGYPAASGCRYDSLRFVPREHPGGGETLIGPDPKADILAWRQPK